MGWTCRVAGVEPGVVRASLVSILARAMDCCLAPAMALTLFLGLMTPVYGGTSYHRFASGLGMNIRHLPCVSRRTGEAGTCMFAYSCAKLNGTHLGTCIDRFYFGSCCRLPPGVAPDALEHVNLDDNFIDDNSIATTEKIKPPQSVKPEYPSSVIPSTIRIPPSTSGYVTSQKPSPTTQRPSPSTQWPSSSSQRPWPSSHRPSPSTQRPPPSVTYPSTQRPSTVQVTSTSIPTKKYPVTTARPPPSPTTPAPTLVTWTTIDGFPPRKPPSVGSGNGVSPASSTTHRTPVTSPAVTVDHSKPTSVFNTTYVVTVTSPKPSSPLPSSPSRPSVTIISTKPSQRPTTVTRPSGSSSFKPVVVVNTNRPSTSNTSRPSSQKPVSTRPSSKPTFKPTKPSTKPPVKVSVKPSSKPVTSVTILSTQKPSSPKPTKTGTTGTKPSRPSSQKPSTPSPTIPSTVKPTSSKPVVKPTAKPSPKPTRPKPTKPTKPSTTQKITPKPTKPSTTRPPTTTDASTDPWVQVSVSSHEPSLQTTIYFTSESPWTSVRPGSTEESTLPITFTTEVPTFTSPTVTSPDNNIDSSPSHPSSTVSPTFLPPVDSNEILNINMSDFKDVCGRRLFPEPRIVGGNKSTFGKWPWQISLRQWRTSTYLHKCGAALLSENWAITAAHCVENVPPSDLLLRLGEYDLSTEEEPYTFQERRVQIVASHPQFDPRTFEYDLALLRFYDPVQFQPNIIPICVPEDDTNFVGKTAHVTGWGRLYEDGPLPMVLQEVSVPVINNTVCETMYRAAGYIEHIPDIFICAGWKKGGFDSCEGDSGGPMVLERGEDKRWILAGVISWGIGCAEPNQPGVYTRISHFRHWINQILQF